MDVLSLKELCEELSISMATGRNWLRLGKIVPERIEGKQSYFGKMYVEQLIKDMESGVNTALKSRRNKKYVSGHSLYRSYISEKSKNLDSIQDLLYRIKDKNITLDNTKIQILLADCAVQLFAGRERKNAGLATFLDGEISFGNKDNLVMDLLKNIQVTREWICTVKEVFEISYCYEEKEDILGLLYMSCKNIGNRKVTGSYYTPTKITRQLIEKIIEKNGTDKKFLDPCCGTGNFLLQLPETCSMEQIYGNDLDPISVKIARINMALRFPNAEMEMICQHITNQNYLSEYSNSEIDVIIGNPPWGYGFSKEENAFLQQNYASAVGKRVESYDVFVEKSLSLLKESGVMSFVIPEAILNAKLHQPIREIILQKTSIQYLQYLGEIFHKVQCPSVILQLQCTDKSFSCCGVEVKDVDRDFIIQKERELNSVCFDLAMTDDEYQIMQKIEGIKNKVYLKKNAEFALGIVTGDNKKYISEEKTEQNEIVMRGSDIYKYRVQEPKQYIRFHPEFFQQVAPANVYRVPEKLLYRFICNQLVFAYDNKQTLSLNSCNILIPKIPDMEIKYVLAVLNSRVAQFVFWKKFRSIKVLRTHIEQIPIPVVTLEKQREIIKLVDDLLQDTSEKRIVDTYENLDKQIAEIFGLRTEEYQILKHAVDGENKFLVF